MQLTKYCLFVFLFSVFLLYFFCHRVFLRQLVLLIVFLSFCFTVSNMSLCLFVLVHLSSSSFEVVLVLLRSFLPFWAIGSKKGWIRWDGMVIIGHRSSKSNFCAEKKEITHMIISDC